MEITKYHAPQSICQMLHRIHKFPGFSVKYQRRRDSHRRIIVKIKVVTFKQSRRPLAVLVMKMPLGTASVCPTGVYRYSMITTPSTIQTADISSILSCIRQYKHKYAHLCMRTCAFYYLYLLISLAM